MPRQTQIAILIADKVDFKPKLIRRHKEHHCILIKGSIHQKDKIIVYKLSGQTINKDTSEPNFPIYQTELQGSTGYAIQQMQSTHSSQQTMEKPHILGHKISLNR
jgi:hypothetical protein